MVRSSADILPKIRVVKDCPFNCSPSDPSNMCPRCSERYKKGEKLPTEEREMVVVDLPLGATEDRVVGSLDVEKAIKQGIEALEPGILAEANQNVLYVDEVNLLPDHIADDLLDAAATGWNSVEREGISVSHPSRFIFVGTMNPEEGELRPQLLDRFALSVTVGAITSVEDRVEVVKRNMNFSSWHSMVDIRTHPSDESSWPWKTGSENLTPVSSKTKDLPSATSKVCAYLPPVLSNIHPLRL
jgi:Mg-chelatase subunit ChlI